MNGRDRGACTPPRSPAGGRRLLLLALLVLAFLGVRWYFAWREGKSFAEFLGELLEPPRTEERAEPRVPPRAEPRTPASRGAAPSRFDWRDGETVTGRGRVTKILADDLVPPRHQRFLVADDVGRTLLVAHNIDLAPRLAGLKAGDTVAFCGEYRDNDRGGVIHYTHADPSGRRAAGWVKVERAPSRRSGE